MKVAVFSTKPYDQRFLSAASAHTDHDLVFLEDRLAERSAALAAGCEAVCAFVNDELGAPTLRVLAGQGIRVVALRCAGFNQVDVKAAEALGISIRRVPAYSPYAVAEFTIGLMLTLSRKYHRAFNRVREGNFGIDGLLGFDLHGRTVGFIGTGKIGLLTAKPLGAMGCALLGCDPFHNPEFETFGGSYVSLEALLERSDIISLHCPLTPESYHLINAQTLARMKPGVMIINTSRGALIDAVAMVEALKRGQVGFLGIDVYEQEADIFYEDLSGEILQDDVLQRLLTFPNVLVTSHQAYFTDTALQNIAETTIANLSDFEHGRASANEVKAEKMHGGKEPPRG
ncbi:MAG: 2-hydroxyacid dehydrogenase [Chthoniobacteraceae bacterium]